MNLARDFCRVFERGRLEREMSFDVVIPLGPNDVEIVQRCIDSVRQYVTGVGDIYVVSWAPIELRGAKCVEESGFPFQKADVAEKVNPGRAGWYLQQLLKLYAPFQISGIRDAVLVVDADTVFHRPVRFLSEGKYLVDYNHETHAPYFRHMLRLHPTFKAWKPSTSGIVNTMILDRRFLKEIFDLVEGHHGNPFWVAFLDCVEPGQAAGASEYEIYFHYCMRVHGDRMKVRRLQINNYGRRNRIEGEGYHYVSYHWHLGK
jgi:hypothetical protein